jgi:hypothetical protein
VKTLSILWFIYAGFSLLMGTAALVFVNAFLYGFFVPMMHGSGAAVSLPGWFFPVIMLTAWIFLAVRSGLAIAAGWGLREHAEWGRIVAIIAAIFSLLRIPLGTALGVWTLVVLLDSRNTTLYKQL